MQWGKRRIGGVLYDLTHLDPVILAIPGFEQQSPILARLRYGAHVFTLKWSDNYIDEYRILDGRQSRCFCPIRYAHSLHLPHLIQTHCGGRVMFDPQKKLVLLGNPPGSLEPYAIFFELTRARSKPYQLDMLVVSAHERPRIRAKLGMPLPKLAAMVVSGKPVPWPKK